MITVTFGNQKGGVGKTTTSQETAAGLAARGYSVLAIDTDAQANLTTHLGMSPAPHLYNLLVRDQGWEETLRLASPDVWQIGQSEGRLAVVGSNIESRGIPLYINDPWILAERLQQVEDLFDVVVIDKPPTPSLLDVLIINATDYYVLVTEAEVHSFTGMRATIASIESLIEKKGAGVRIAGIQTNRFRPNTLEHKENFAELTDWSKYPVWEPIKERIVWAEAAHARQSVEKFAPRDKAAQEARALVDRVEVIIGGYDG